MYLSKASAPHHPKLFLNLFSWNFFRGHDMIVLFNLWWRHFSWYINFYALAPKSTEIWINGDVVMFAEQSPKGRKKRKEVRKPKSWRLFYIKVSCRVSRTVLDSFGYSPLRWTLVWGSLWSNAIFSTRTRKKKRRKVVGKKRLNASNTTKESTVCQKSHFCPKILFLTKPLWST